MGTLNRNEPNQPAKYQTEPLDLSVSAYKCGNCGICFSSPRNLAAHTVYYCTQRAEGTLKATEESSEESPSVASKSSDMILSSDQGSLGIKRSLSPSDDERPQSKSPKQDRVFQCPYCTYTTDRKGSLTRHLRVHVVTPDDVVPLVTPASARYCSNCDIQFSSYKTFTVHKQFYCNTRSVQKSANNGPATPSPNGTPNCVTPKTPGLTPVTPQQLANQPLFAAISTNPLILVPCAYVPGSGLVPIQAGATAPDGTPITAGAIQVAAGAALATAAASVAGSLSPVPTSENRDKDESILPDRSTPDDREPTSPGSQHQDCIKKEAPDTPAPLDLSTTPKKEISTDEGSNHDCASPADPDIEVANDLSSGGSNSQKQGTFRCDECNIMFFKQENLAAHKRYYCAVRQQKLTVSTDSVDQEDSQSVSPNKDSAVAQTPSPRPATERMTTTPKSDSGRTSTPVVQASSPPSNQSSAMLPSVGSQPVFQFYCIACGIKFTSLNNLQAHQTYYCPKREVLQGTVRVGVMSRPVMEMQCPKCRITYPNEDQLKAHACCARKCPYCDVYCSSHSAAQRHLATHAGIKAFKCTLCGYKGHTLRGMRTHVRIHVEKGALIQEENFIVCVGENGEPIPPPPSGANIMHFLAAKSPSLDPADQQAAQLREDNSNEQRILGAVANVVANLPAICQSSVAKSISPSIASEQPDRERLPSPSLSNSKDSPTSSAADPAGSNPESPAKPEMHHWCNFCGYSSSYKGNVVRHIKLIHRDVLAGGFVGLGQQQQQQSQASAFSKILLGNAEML